MNAALSLLAQADNATGVAQWWQEVRPIALCPLLWSLVLGGLGMWLMLPGGGRRARMLGGLFAAVGLGLLAAYLPLLGLSSEQGFWFYQIVFWLLAAVTLVSAVAAIAARSPVYSAVWFALSLLSTAGLFLLVQAQFLAVATVAVYAGAILVMFLFVLMLAQPEGHSFYDRITWGPFAPAFATLAAVVIVGGLAYQQEHFDNDVLKAQSPVSATPKTNPLLAESEKPADGEQEVSPNHMANIGVELFGRHLVAVEVAGTLLLVALVGALAIVIQGRETRPSQPAAAQSQGGAGDG